ncbi:hypothetical protein CW362_24785 [Streptomyces populi]|uniref:Uncharacterized protein n=1 Tax=Streptomyces populi TaxID=2058924 RepID=A0A2I0SKD4_9ACTN|nr:hypothetical protein [Streptomyces populi]PKT70379.1 hypothetical protein CW362_24785 [Streptomyces populi]
MDQVLISLVAVGGTLMGALLGYVLQRQSADRSERKAAVLTYTGAITETIRGQQDWWYRQDENPEGPEHRAARIEAHRLRGVARQAINGIAFYVDDDGLLDLAEATFQVASDIHRADGRGELDTRTAAARESLRIFIHHASEKVR